MKIICPSIVCVIFIMTFFSCKEEAALDYPCGCESETIEYYDNVNGTISRFDTIYYIKIYLPDNDISIQPCEGFINKLKNEGLKVTVSGELKKMCPAGDPHTKVFTPFILKSIQISN